MRIYVDIDDILCETAAALCGLAAREFGRHVAYADVRVFNLQEAFGLSDEEMRRFVVLSHEYGRLMSFAVTPGAVEGVRALRDMGAEVNILTGRPASSHKATEDWLASVGLGDFQVEYVNKYGRHYASNPGDPPTVPLDELLARQYDFAIDDSPVVLKALAAWDKTDVLVFDRPWNRAYALAPNMTRVGGWDEIVAKCRSGRRDA